MRLTGRRFVRARVEVGAETHQPILQRIGNKTDTERGQVRWLPIR